MLLEYSLGTDRSYLWAVTPTTVTAYTLPKGAEIDAAALRFYKLQTERNLVLRHETVEEKKERLTRAETELPQAAAALSQMILAPVATELKSKRLLIVGDGPERKGLVKYLEAFNLSESAELTGAVAPSEVPGLLASMDAAVVSLRPQQPGGRWTALKSTLQPLGRE